MQCPLSASGDSRLPWTSWRPNVAGVSADAGAAHQAVQQHRKVYDSRRFYHVQQPPLFAVADSQQRIWQVEKELQDALANLGGFMRYIMPVRRAWRPRKCTVRWATLLRTCWTTSAGPFTTPTTTFSHGGSWPSGLRSRWWTGRSCGCCCPRWPRTPAMSRGTRTKTGCGPAPLGRGACAGVVGCQ